MDAAGDVVAAGGLKGPETSFIHDFAVVKLDGESGTEQWRQVIGAGEYGYGSSVAV